MKVDCRWVNAKLEDYFCDRLDAEQVQLTLEHLQSCENCNREVQSLRNVDGLVQQLFRHRMSAAKSPHVSRRRIALPFALAGTGVALASVLALALWTRPEVPAPPVAVAPAAAPIQQTSTPPAPAEIKTPDATGVAPTPRLLKPEAPSPTRPPRPAADVPVAPNAPPFAVTDAAGFSRTLEDYRGSIVLFGLWSPAQPQAARNLEHLYKEFGASPKVQVFGVASRRQDRLPGTSFPVMFNNGSKLLGAQNAQFVLVDASGKERLRGSLLGDEESIVAKIRSELDQLR